MKRTESGKNTIISLIKNRLSLHYSLKKKIISIHIKLGAVSVNILNRELTLVDAEHRSIGTIYRFRAE